MAGTNCFEGDFDRYGYEGAGPIQRAESEPRPCVFISYRHQPLDSGIANAVDVLLRRLGLDTYFDKQDRCVTSADKAGNEEGVASCLELALDRSTALLSVTTQNTFTSAWPPYEIGSARGRKKFFPDGAITPPLPRVLRLFMPSLPSLVRSPSIAHLIHREVTELLAFVRLGVPILDWPALTAWARFLMGVPHRPLESTEDMARSPGELDDLDDALPAIRDPMSLTFRRR